MLGRLAAYPRCSADSRAWGPQRRPALDRPERTVGRAETVQTTPEWIPQADLEQLDLTELADWDGLLKKECVRLGAELGAYVAAYRHGAKPRAAGLCSVYRYARLDQDGAHALAATERRHAGITFVVYARPLERW